MNSKDQSPCEQCGAALTPAVRFCPNCGVKIAIQVVKTVRSCYDRKMTKGQPVGLETGKHILSGQNVDTVLKLANQIISNSKKSEDSANSTPIPPQPGAVSSTASSRLSRDPSQGSRPANTPPPPPVVTERNGANPPSPSFVGQETFSNPTHKEPRYTSMNPPPIPPLKRNPAPKTPPPPPGLKRGNHNTRPVYGQPLTYQSPPPIPLTSQHNQLTHQIGRTVQFVKKNKNMLHYLQSFIRKLLP